MLEDLLRDTEDRLPSQETVRVTYPEARVIPTTADKAPCHPLQELKDTNNMATNKDHTAHPRLRVMLEVSRSRRRKEACQTQARLLLVLPVV